MSDANQNPPATPEEPRAPGPTNTPGPSGPIYGFDISALQRAWPILQDNLVNWVAATFVIFAAGFFGSIVLFALFRLFPYSLAFRLVRFTPGAVVFSLCFAALTDLALKTVDGEAWTLNDLFRFRGRLKETLIAALAMGVLAPLNFFGVFVFVVPLILDRKMLPIDAFRLSFETVAKQFAVAFAAYLVISLVGFLGFVACGAGLLITMPLVTIAFCLIYRDFFPKQLDL